MAYLSGFWLLLPPAPLLLSCSHLDLPQGPELAELDAAYDDPTGVIDEKVLAEIAPLVTARLDAILSLGRLDFVTESLSDVSNVVKETFVDEGETHFRVKAVASVKRVCPGSAGSNAAGGAGNADGGTLTYTMRVQENGVLDTVWGDFDQCQLVDAGETQPGPSSLPREGGAVVTYDGSMDIYLGGNLKFSELDFQRFLFRLVGSLEVGAEDVDVDFDFRVDRTHRTEIRVPARSGDIVVSFTPNVDLATLEAGDGSYCCDFQDRSCVFAGGNDCDEVVAGDQILRW